MIPSDIFGPFGPFAVIRPYGNPPYLDYVKLRNNDPSSWCKDLDLFLNSSFVREHELIVDERVVRSDFDLFGIGDVLEYSTEQCLHLLRSNPDKYICLTLGTSYWMPNIGNEDAWDYTRGFAYPALSGCEAYIAEIHCSCHDSRIFRYYRISVYKIDGINKKTEPLFRFENGKVIDEHNLKPGESLAEVLSVERFDDPGAYKEALNAEGEDYPIICCAEIQSAQNQYGITFPQAFEASYVSREERRAYLESKGIKVKKETR